METEELVLDLERRIAQRLSILTTDPTDYERGRLDELRDLVAYYSRLAKE